MAANSSLQPYLECIPKSNRKRVDLKLDSGHGGVQKDLGTIAGAMYQWEGDVATSLGLSKVDIADIRTTHRDSLKLQTRAALQRWMEKYGLNATYRNLMVAFLNAKKPDYVEAVCRVLGGTPENIKGASFQITPTNRATSNTTTFSQSSRGGGGGGGTRLNTRDHYHAMTSFLSPFAAHWREIGEALEFFPNELTIIQTNMMLMTQGSSGYLSEMITKWLQWAPGDGRGSRNFATFEDLRDALLKVSHTSAEAHKLGPALGIVSKADKPLTFRDHFDITKAIHDVPNNDIINLGENLGLSRPKLLRMTDLPGDMVAAWLRQEDHVISNTGTPTWRMLANGLDAVNQCGVADIIRMNVGIECVTAGNGRHSEKTPQPSPSKTIPVSKSVSEASIITSGEGDGFSKMLTDMGIGHRDRKILIEHEINEVALKCLKPEDLLHMNLSLGCRRILEQRLKLSQVEDGNHGDDDITTPPPPVHVDASLKQDHSESDRNNHNNGESVNAATVTVSSTTQQDDILDDEDLCEIGEASSSESDQDDGEDESQCNTNTNANTNTNTNNDTFIVGDRDSEQKESCDSNNAKSKTGWLGRKISGVKNFFK